MVVAPPLPLHRSTCADRFKTISKIQDTTSTRSQVITDPRYLNFLQKVITILLQTESHATVKCRKYAGKYGRERGGSGTNPCTTTRCLIGNLILFAILSSTTLFYAHRQLGEHREPTAGCAPDAWGVLRNHNGLLCDQLPQSVKTQLEATKGLPRKLREQSYRAIPIPHKTAHDHAGDSMGASLMRARLDAKEARKKKRARRDAQEYGYGLSG